MSDSKRKSATQKVILDLSKHADKQVLVRLSGGRQVRGILKGWDPLLNLVLDEAIEELRDPNDVYVRSGEERKLGLLVARGTSVMTISPVEGCEQIENPFQKPQPVMRIIRLQTHNRSVSIVHPVLSIHTSSSRIRLQAYHPFPLMMQPTDLNPLHPHVIPLYASKTHHWWGKSPPASLAGRLHCLNRNTYLDTKRPYSEIIISSNDPHHARLAHLPTTTLLQHIQDQVIEVDPTIVDFYSQLHQTGLPFVLKVVSVTHPQPLRTHPDSSTAETLAATMGFERPEPHPVMIVALADVDALFGFQSAADIVTEISRVPEFADAVGRPETDQFVHIVKTSVAKPQHIRQLISHLLSRDVSFITDCLANAKKRLLQMPKDSVTENDRQLIALQEMYPDDPMCFAVYLLNRVQLTPGKAVFIHTQEPYTVLNGDFLEAATNSDAVLLGGLSKEGVNKSEFANALSCDDSPVEISTGERFSDYGVSYVPPVPHYQLLDFKLSDGVSQQVVQTMAPSILVGLGGEGYVSIEEKAHLLPLREGSIYYLSPQTSFVVTSCANDGAKLHFVQIGVNESAAPSSSSSCAVM